VMITEGKSGMGHQAATIVAGKSLI
jgi:hypothetical protein